MPTRLMTLVGEDECAVKRAIGQIEHQAEHAEENRCQRAIEADAWRAVRRPKAPEASSSVLRRATPRCLRGKGNIGQSATLYKDAFGETLIEKSRTPSIIELRL